MSDIQFLISGQAAFVLPSFRNSRYIQINTGDHYGVIDIIGSISQTEDFEIYNWYDQRSNIKRQFTYMADNDSEVLTLSLEHLNQMQIEFQLYYEDLLNESSYRLR